MPDDDAVLREHGDGRALAAAFGLGAVGRFEPVARGAMGRVFRLETSRGRFAAKECFWERPEESAVAEVSAFTDACRAAGVRCPVQVRGVNGDFVLVGVDGVAWTLQEWADGSPPERTAMTPSRWLMRQAAVIHALALPAPAEPSPGWWYSRTVDDWDRLVADSARQHVEWGEPLAARVKEFRELAGLANDVPLGPTVMCHRDLHFANALVTSEGLHTLVDWENAGPQEPWREIGLALIHLVGVDDEAPGLLAAEYLAAGGAALPGDATLFATGLSVLLNFVQNQAAIALDTDANDDHRAYAAEKVAGMIPGIPTLADLERAAALVARACVRWPGGQEPLAATPRPPCTGRACRRYR